MDQTVLIVEGNKRRLRRLGRLVSERGYPVLYAASGAEALGLVAASHPPVVIAGGRLPDQDIDVLVREIKRRFRDVEILVLADEPWVIEELKPIAAGFLTKPFNSHLIDVHILRACERASQRRRLREMPHGIIRRFEKKVGERLETERFLTVKQIVDKLSTFIGQIARDVEGGVRYFNEIPYFVAIHDRQGRVLAANRSYRLLLGGGAGDASCLIYEGRSGGSDECPAGRTLRTGNAQESREIVRYRSGSRVPVIVHTAPIFNNDGEVELVLEVSAGTRDVEQLRDELQNTQQRYGLLFDAVPCYVAGLDPDLRVTTANRLFTNEFGEKIGVSFREVFLIDDDTFLDSPIQKTLSEGKPFNGEVALTGPNGRAYHMLVWTSPVTTAAGKLMQVLVIFLDITQIRELQSNLASLGLMIGSISHSIKGVLTGLDAGLYLLNKGIFKGDDAQVQSGLEIVRSIAERIRKMVMDILFCAKERELQRERIGVRALVEDVVRTVQPLFRSKNVELVCELERDLGFFEVDPGMLRSAFVNLLENAAEACAAEGSAKAYRTVFGIEANADVVGFLVEDNGIGMTPEQLKNLFTVFFSTKGSKGTGLGLFITDKIIRQHGGTITVDSAVGRGARFGIMIPRRAAVP
ncbi:MAG: PAS domain-containing protein [Desulfobacterales bacterium]|nr:PAS domain-containing protein [Desulfobacterales bacterium]